MACLTLALTAISGHAQKLLHKERPQVHHAYSCYIYANVTLSSHKSQSSLRFKTKDEMTTYFEVFCFVVRFDHHTEDDTLLFAFWLYPWNHISHALKRSQSYDLDRSIKPRGDQSEKIFCMLIKSGANVLDFWSLVANASHHLVK